MITPSPPAVDSVVAAWQARERLEGGDAIRGALRLLGVLSAQPHLVALVPPPSAWRATARVRIVSTDSAADAKTLAKIRALLAKAEATTFAEEAEAFSAKAQELMARHAIDAAMLHEAAPGTGGPVNARRVHIEEPYAESKVHLLAAVAGANSARVVWDNSAGFATVFAYPVDLGLIDVLFTSLLVQAGRAATSAAVAAGRTRTPSFRRAFLWAYAVRIGERLHLARRFAEEAAVVEHGSALVPVLASRTEAVDEAMRRTFPETRTVRRRSVDAQGWRAGRQAADLAHLDGHADALSA